MTTRTQVGILGAGPAGLMLAHELYRAGISSVLIESRSRDYCEARVRAGVLEQGTVDALDAAGLGERLHREGLVHGGTALRFNGRSHRIDFAGLTGKSVTVYGQQEVVRDLIGALTTLDADLRFECTANALEQLEGESAIIRYSDADGTPHEIACDYVAGCDGFHGLSRQSFPAGMLEISERVYPFSWLGILADTPPIDHELIYANHPRGFALASARSPFVSRLYLQCAPDEDLNAWPDERIWDELRLRFAGEDAPELIPGPITQRGVTPMRSFVAAPMRFARLFLAGDAAHIVPPTGAKGMNLAIADVLVLARALRRFYANGDLRALDEYSDTCLRRVWKTQRFSWWMTSMLHQFPGATPFDLQIQTAELDYVTGSRAGATTLAENYVGLPFEHDRADAAAALA
jgi:p-hydroxybenzoate 3-monooxygenase